MTWPPAEFELNHTTVAELVASQHPDLAHLELSYLAEGFDNATWRLGDDFVVRLPRRGVAATLLAHELEWLPVLAPTLPLPTSVALRAGKPTERYPCPWAICAWLEGTPGDLVVPGAASAPILGGFLAALHQPGPPTAPSNPYRGGHPSTRAEVVDRRVGVLAEHVDSSRVLAAFSTACSAPPATTPTWLHGDLHPGNMLYDGDQLCAVLDFGDLCSGDPATDLAGGLLALPSTSLETFFAAYGGADANLLLRTAGWAIAMGVLLAELGMGERPSYLAMGLRGVTSGVELVERLG